MNEGVIGRREAVWNFRFGSWPIEPTLRLDSVVVPAETASPIDLFCLIEDRLPTREDVVGCCCLTDEVAGDLCTYSITSMLRNC